MTAVVAFSSAGRVPGLVNEHSYAGLTAPTLMVTGDLDTVEDAGITDWRDHLYPFETSPAGNKMLAIRSASAQAIDRRGFTVIRMHDLTRLGVAVAYTTGRT